MAPNLLQRDFTAERPDQKWLTDTLAPHASAGVTYISTQEGWLYLAVVFDLYSRRIVGWAMATRMMGDLTRAALQMAIQQRQPTADLIHHSDQGSQYTAGEYQQLLQSRGIQVSMNSAGTWYDNAPMESFFGTLEGEWVNHHHYLTRDEARVDIFYYIEAFYNRQRLHSVLDYLSPVDYEQLYHQQRSGV